MEGEKGELCTGRGWAVGEGGDIVVSGGADGKGELCNGRGWEVGGDKIVSGGADGKGELCNGRGWAVGGMRLSAEGLMERESFAMGGAGQWAG